MSDPLCTDPSDEDFEQEERELEKSGLYSELTRRRFMQTAGTLSAAVAVGLPGLALAEASVATRAITLQVNGKPQTLSWICGPPCWMLYGSIWI